MYDQFSVGQQDDITYIQIMRSRHVFAASAGYERDTAESAIGAIARDQSRAAVVAGFTLVPEDPSGAADLPIRGLIDSMRVVQAMRSIVWLQSTAFTHP